jgi:hypothetical protein
MTATRETPRGEAKVVVKKKAVWNTAFFATFITCR